MASFEVLFVIIILCMCDNRAMLIPASNVMLVQGALYKVPGLLYMFSATRSLKITNILLSCLDTIHRIKDKNHKPPTVALIVSWKYYTTCYESQCLGGVLKVISEPRPAVPQGNGS